MDHILPYLVYLACPIGMGMMMWMMMRGGHGQQTPTERSAVMPQRHALDSAPAGDADHDLELERLRAQLSDLQRQQTTIAAEIGRLATDDLPAATERPERTEATSVSTVHAKPPALDRNC